MFHRDSKESVSHGSSKRIVVSLRVVVTTPDRCNSVSFLLSQPLDSQDEVKVFDYALPAISKWLVWEEKFVTWLSGWENDVWTVKDAKDADIEQELFFKEFELNFPLPNIKYEILSVLRSAYPQ